jgi:hypothetical protein
MRSRASSSPTPSRTSTARRSGSTGIGHARGLRRRARDAAAALPGRHPRRRRRSLHDAHSLDFDGTQILVKHTATTSPKHPNRVKAPNGTCDDADLARARRALRRLRRHCWAASSTNCGRCARTAPSRSLRWALAVPGRDRGRRRVMQFALITHNFSLAYVAENNATFTPLLYSITGMWSALEGSLLLGSLLLAPSSCVVILLLPRRRDDRWSPGPPSCSSA